MADGGVRRNGPEQASGLAGRHVLVVEDQFIVAFELADWLTGLGCVVVGPAATNHQAIALIAREAIDVAAIDVNLAGERSTPTAEALRAAGVPFVVITGYATDHLHEPVLSEAPRVVKPTDPARLRRALLEAL
jgi:CheY-like chemotaxis protein